LLCPNIPSGSWFLVSVFKPNPKRNSPLWFGGEWRYRGTPHHFLKATPTNSLFLMKGA
jgi:hypothetical protein